MSWDEKRIVPHEESYPPASTRVIRHYITRAIRQWLFWVTMTSARRLTKSTSITAHAAAIAAVAYLDDKKVSKRRSSRARPRIRRSVEEIYESLGPTYFRRAYRMTYESFLKLHQKLHEGIQRVVSVVSVEKRNKRVSQRGTYRRDRHFKTPPVPNGPIATTVRLACAIRYFAGGSPYDLMGK